MTTTPQDNATDRNHRQNQMAKWSTVLAVISALVSLLAYDAHWQIATCCLTGFALVSGAEALYVAASEHWIVRSALVLFVTSALVNLLLPEAAKERQWSTGLLFTIQMNFSLLCFTGAVVALLRNTFGRLEWIERHDKASVFALAVFLVMSAYFKTYTTLWHAAEFADLSLVLAGVVISAMLEKGRARHRHERKANKAEEKTAEKDRKEAAKKAPAKVARTTRA